ncbi:hypothetical protein CC80DRAFT_566054 [Byssothecium circinans]|uniref:Uncharacterized protein n=1 Tax=Byssothecium circinans TaxID=147558 RepID=A0A6A5TRM2_9PLEO|nr:hypothetical protein CC80DRAFT_566054 [Byssothecium circinans]
MEQPPQSFSRKLAANESFPRVDPAQLGLSPSTARQGKEDDRVLAAAFSYMNKLFPGSGRAKGRRQSLRRRVSDHQVSMDEGKTRRAIEALQRQADYRTSYTAPSHPVEDAPPQPFIHVIQAPNKGYIGIGRYYQEREMARTSGAVFVTPYDTGLGNPHRQPPQGTNGSHAQRPCQGPAFSAPRPAPSGGNPVAYGLFGAYEARQYPPAAPAAAAERPHGSNIQRGTASKHPKQRDSVARRDHPNVTGPESDSSPVPEKRISTKKGAKPQVKRISKKKAKAVQLLIGSDSDTSEDSGSDSEEDGLIFKSHKAAMKWQEKDEWAAPKEDDTIPSTNKERRVWVRKLVAAFKDVSQYNDKVSSIFVNRWYDPDHPELGYKGFHKPEAVEKACWELMRLAEEIHRRGIGMLTLSDKKIRADSKKTKSWTFEHRMNSLVSLLASYKARCDSLMKGAPIETIVVNPEAARAGSGDNRYANDRRNIYIQQGRQVAGANKGAVEEEDQETEDADESAPLRDSSGRFLAKAASREKENDSTETPHQGAILNLGSEVDAEGESEDDGSDIVEMVGRKRKAEDSPGNVDERNYKHMA